jgi:ABC-type glycerol-3-phosphate transport system permease component
VLADSLYSMPLGTLVLYTYMAAVPVAFREAAQVEGASRGQILRRVLVPLSAPALATTSVFAFLAAWGDYLFAETLITGSGSLPASTAVYALGGPGAMAGSLVLAGPAVLAVVFFQRFIRTGLSAGGLAG